jgi:cyclopropane fatty-acyl-phospholipid synthase-like methyltransferase
MAAEENFFPKELKLNFTPHLRHFDRYFQSLKLLNKIGKDEIWVDCASGSGYGTNILSNFTKKIYGFDISTGAVKYANENYSSNNCEFIYNLNDINEDVAVIFSVETIEHMCREDGEVFLGILYNKLLDEGQLIITTPIVKKTNNTPKNKFHILEYSDEDFKGLLLGCNFIIDKTFFIETTFTDGETKDQGYYKCHK